VVNLKDLPVSQIVKVKVGCRVMTCVNNDIEGYYNGSVGTVKDIVSEDIVIVRLDNGNDVVVTRHEFTNLEYVTDASGVIKQKRVGSFSQMPLKLFYAISSHKSQGSSLDKAIVNMNGAFAEGQTYVALSRLRTVDGLFLENKLTERDVKVDKHVVEFISKNVKEV
jgi:ATP-dependent exoDNAse (exonuclease V) alpha subunit